MFMLNWLNNYTNNNNKYAFFQAEAKTLSKITVYRTIFKILHPSLMLVPVVLTCCRSIT